MRMLAVFFIFGATIAHAGPYEARYHGLVRSDLRDSQHLATRFRTQDKSLCPQVKAGHHEECLLDYLRRQNIRSSAQLSGLLKASGEVSAQTATGNKTEDNMHYADGLLTTIERVRLEEFHLHKSEPRDGLEREERAATQKSDEKVLARLKEDTLKKAQAKLNEAQPNISQRPRIEHLRKRIATARNSLWVYPLESRRDTPKPVEFKAMVLVAPDYRDEEWCSHYSVGKCFNYDFADCNDKLNKALHECVQNRACAVGKWIRQAQVTKKMSQEKECAEVFIPLTGAGAPG